MPLKMTGFLIVFLTLITAGSLPSLDLSTLLRQGPVITIQQDGKGRFQSATARVYVNAPPEYVWNTILDLDNYKKFMPKVVFSRVLRREANHIIARFEIEVPMVNTKYTLRYNPDRERNRIDIKRVEGDLAGSHWHWRLTPMKKGTLVTYTGTTKNFSSLLSRVEDDQQTITVGVNISAVMAATKAVKIKAEADYAAAGGKGG